MKTGFLSAFLGSVAAFLSAVVQAQSVFNGSGTGPILDAPDVIPAEYGTPLLVTFDVNGLINDIQTISLSITAVHTWVGDLDVVLSPPAASGLSSFTIFSRVGNPANAGTGYGSDLNGTYTFSDSGGNLWIAAGNIGTESVIPPANYRTSTADGTPTSFASDSAFIGMTPTQANGTWTLALRDGSNLDTGSVSAASLSITAVPEPQAYAFTVALSLLGFAIYWRRLQFS